MTVQPIPEGFHTITPYLLLDDVPAFLDFVTQAFDATTIERMEDPDGTVRHAQVQIGTSRLMTGSAQGPWPPTSTFLYLYVEDADAWYQRALAAGATSMQEPKDEFYGDRTAGVKDASGTLWWLATHQEDVSPEEMQRRAAATLE